MNTPKDGEFVWFYDEGWASWAVGKFSEALNGFITEDDEIVPFVDEEGYNRVNVWQYQCPPHW